MKKGYLNYLDKNAMNINMIIYSISLKQNKYKYYSNIITFIYSVR